MNIHTRIKQRRLQRKMSYRDVAAACGNQGTSMEIAWQTVQKWEKPAELGGTTPRRKTLEALAKALDVSVDWLLTGNDANLQLEGEYIFVRRYRRPNIGGATLAASDHHYAVSNLDDETDTYAFRVDFIKRKGLDPDQLRFLNADDDAMEPKIGRGNVVLLDLRQQPIQNDAIYAFESPGPVRLRRCFVRLDGLVTLRGDNPKYPEEVAPSDRLPLIGRVVLSVSDDY